MTETTQRLSITESRDKTWVNLTFSLNSPWQLRAEFDDGTVWRVEDSDLFECLTQIRRKLEIGGGRICCAGARRDVFPSGMSRQMGGGRQAYVLGEVAVLVDIFSRTDCASVVTVDEQIESVRWLQHG